MRLNGVYGACLLTALGCLGVAVEAQAADLGPLYDAPSTYAEPQQPMEFGTGWYLRGDGAYAEEDHPKFDKASGSFDRKATAGGYAFGIGAGYKLNSFFRADVTADFLDPFDYSGQTSCGTGCELSAKNHIWRWDTLANGYVDLGTWYGITPYVGAGAGVGVTLQEAQLTTSDGSPAPATPTSHNAYQFAWAGMAGFSYAFAPHAMIDVGYRYLNLGRTSLALFPLAATQKTLSEQQVRIGIRYMVD